jgi:hypothetical protein
MVEIHKREFGFQMDKLFEINKTGCHRLVFLTKNYAFKIPVLDEWRLFLRGLLANLQETTFSKAKWPELCPVKFSLPGGWLIVMPRVREMTDSEFLNFDVENFCRKSDRIIPAEWKANSFGWYQGNIVAIDYG